MEYVFRLVLLCWCFVLSVRALCPEKCTCKNVSNSVRVKCGSDESRVENWKELEFEAFAANITNLDLGKNALNTIDKDYFRNFTELKRLDLSSNALQKIDSNSLGDALPNLERLKLYNNSIGHIYSGSFDQLPNLKQVDISNNPLVCDCDLVWLLAWANAHLVKLQPPPKCESPEDFRGTYLKKLKVGVDLHCESPLQPLLELVPKKNQVVFEGDGLTLKCRAPRGAIGIPRDSEDLPTRAHVFWGWSETIRHQNSTEDIVYSDPTKVFADVYLEETKHISDSGILSSTLKVDSVSRNHTGMWDCTLRSQQANLSQAISVIVISKSTQYCEAVVEHTNKGVYHWPRTVRGETVQQECVEEVDPNTTATYHCGDNGRWQLLNTDACAYVSETTRLLEQFAKVNLTLTKANAYDIARRLHNFTHAQLQLHRIRDPMDLEFIARTLRQYVDYVPGHSETAYLLLDVVSQLLVLPRRIYREAQRMHGTGLKLLHAVEACAEYVQSATLAQQEELQPLPRNLFVDIFNIGRAQSFTGLSCIWFSADAAQRMQRSFECSTSNESFPIFEPYIDAGLQLPPAQLLFEDTQPPVKLLVAIFRNANLLTHMPRNGSATDELELTSVVIGTRLLAAPEDIRALDVSDKISIILRVRPYHNEASAPRPAWWDNETQSWNTLVCQTLYQHRGLVMFTCNRLGYYGLLQRTRYLNDFERDDAGALFRFAPIGIYIGCAVLFVCTWVNIATFVVFGRGIRINRQQRHSFVNTWLALSTLALAFAVGIYQTEYHNVCQVFGILMHYLSLCVLLWLCVSLSTMYKRLSKSHRGVVAESDVPKEARVKKPILGLYLVGWGIGMIICGISSAVNVSEYAAYSFCFLHNPPALNAIIVPAAILLLFLGILFLCIYYHLSQKAVNVLQQSHQQFSDTQATENIDLDWLDSTQSTAARRALAKPNQLEQYRSLTLSSPLSSIVDDYERSNMAHFRAHFLFLLLFATAWLSAATFVVQSSSPDHDGRSGHVYSIVFAVACTLLGLFLLLFYTLSRNDTRNEWAQHGSGCCGSSEGSANSAAYNNIYNASTAAMPAPNAALTFKPAYNGSSGSRSNSQCSKNRSSSIRSVKSNSHKNERSSRSLDCPLLGVAGASNSPAIINNNQHMAAINSAAAQIPSAELFYNPNQINVARKFFKKQKRLAKRNNFELQRQMDRFDYADNISDVSSLTGSAHLYSKRHKVNNTNIHYRPQYMDHCGSSVVGACSGIAKPLRIAPAEENNVKSSPLVANIYTNIPETIAPKHEVIKVRANGGRYCKTMPPQVETLSEHDELELESSSREEQPAPLYENTLSPVRTNCHRSHATNLTSTPLKRPPLKEKETPMAEKDMEAMNSLGLPEPTSLANELQGEEEEEELSAPELAKNEIYVSNSLQITNRVDIDDTFSTFLLIRCNQTQSKSLSNLDDVFASSSAQAAMRPPILRTNSTTDVRSGECKSPSAILQTADGAIKNSTSSTYLLGKVTTPSSSDKCDLGDEHNAYALTHRTLSASPTNESDLNYQNSEISIRSHGVYAPQGDNDLNLTLTEDFPYQSSNGSEADDVINELEDEDFFHFGVPLGGADMDAHETENPEACSIDELYEAIKRRSPTTLSGCSDRPTTSAGAIAHELNTSFRNNFVTTAIDKTEAFKPSSAMLAPQGFKENLNDALEDDSSQSSVISYIDPKVNKIERS